MGVEALGGDAVKVAVGTGVTPGIVAAVDVGWGVDVTAGLLVGVGWGVSVGLGGLGVARLLVGGGGFNSGAATEPAARSTDSGSAGFCAAAAWPLTSKVPSDESETMSRVLTGSETLRLVWFVTIASSLLVPCKQKARGHCCYSMSTGRMSTNASSRFGSWLSWLSIPAVDPVALRHHLSVGLPFRSARIVCLDGC